jgi:CBS domain-containing protein
MFDTSQLTAADVMTRDVVTVRPNDTLRQAAQIMLDRAVSSLPVVDAEGHVVGVVSEADLIRPDEVAEKRERWWLDMLAEGEELSPDFLATITTANRSVAKAMHTDFIAVTELTGLSEVAERIGRQNERSVLVMRDGKLVGIIARRDLVKTIARGS